MQITVFFGYLPELRMDENDGTIGFVGGSDGKFREQHRPIPR